MLGSRSLWNAAVSTASASTSTVPPSNVSPMVETIARLRTQSQRFLAKQKHIVWKDPKTWKDPNYLPPANGRAFFMIRQILSEQPRSLHQIIDAGLEMHAKELEERSPGSEEAKLARRAAKKGSKQDTADGNEPKIPEGHPFISTKYLKRHLLHTLESHRLVYQAAIRPVGTRPKLSAEQAKDTKNPSAISTSSSPYAWFLNLPRRTAHPSDPLPRWSMPDHWRRIIADDPSDPTSAVWAEFQSVIAAQKAVQKTRRQNKGIDERTEEEIWQWEKRDPEVTTRKQRFHLNRRQQKNRTKHETRRLSVRRKFEQRNPHLIPREKSSRAAQRVAREQTSSGKTQPVQA